MPPTQNREAKNKDQHPIRLVRNFYARSGFRQLSTTAGFAQLIGCSDSLIRNSESGVFPLSDKLAQRIENATGVSAKWLQNTVVKLKGGNDVSKERILDVDGQPWYPSREGKFHFTDELLDMAELLYERFPDRLVPFMGAMFEALLDVEPPPITDRQSPTIRRRNMRRYLDTYLLPFLRLVGEFEGDSRERFFRALTAGLGARDAATPGSKLLDLWNVLHTQDSQTSPPATLLIKEPRVAAPRDSKRGPSKRGKVKE
jgi:hypothetical protein